MTCKCNGASEVPLKTSKPKGKHIEKKTKEERGKKIMNAIQTKKLKLFSSKFKLIRLQLMNVLHEM